MGTSFAAPFVSGLIGVLMSNYGLTRDEAIDLPRTTADKVDARNPGYTGEPGAGRNHADRTSIDGTFAGSKRFLSAVRR